MLQVDETTIKPFKCHSFLLEDVQIRIINVETQGNGESSWIPSPILIHNFLLISLVEKVVVIGNVQRDDFGVALAVIGIE